MASGRLKVLLIDDDYRVFIDFFVQDHLGQLVHQVLLDHSLDWPSTVLWVEPDHGDEVHASLRDCEFDAVLL